MLTFLAANFREVLSLTPNNRFWLGFTVEGNESNERLGCAKRAVENAKKNTF